MILIPTWNVLSQAERESVDAAKAYLRNRLSKGTTIDWALSLDASRRAERYAVHDLLTGRPEVPVEGVYAEAWRLIQESWSYDTTRARGSSAVHDIQRRIRAGECSVLLVDDIASLVQPMLVVKAFEDRPGVPVRKVTQPDSVQELFSASLSSHNIHSMFGGRSPDIGLSEVSNLLFLRSLALSLAGKVENGLLVAKRIYGNEENWGPSARPARVYFDNREGGQLEENVDHDRDQDPDRFSRGLAPAVKFLYMTLERIGALDPSTIQPFLYFLRHSSAEVYRRLWSALARSPELVSDSDVGDFFSSISPMEFWNLALFPEVAELRAVRFGRLDDQSRRLMLQALEQGPPREVLPARLDSSQIEQFSEHLKAREMRRIEVAGGELTPEMHDWLVAASARYADLAAMTVLSGFRGRLVRSVPTIPGDPVNRYDELEGEERLQALTDDLTSRSASWHDDPAKQATAWLQEGRNAAETISDLEAVAGSKTEYWQVWDVFGWYHGPNERTGEENRRPQEDANRVLTLLGQLSDTSLAAAVGGISHWLQTWRQFVVRSEHGVEIWQRMWPICVAATNRDAEDEESDEFDRYWKSQEVTQGPADVDTLNSPAGRLVSVLLKALLLKVELTALSIDKNVLIQARAQALEAPGYSGLIARSLFVEALPLLFEADPEWTMQNLVSTLLGDSDDTVVLWRAVAMRTLDKGTLEVIGDEATKKLLDSRLGEPASESLVFSLVREGLCALREGREMAISEVQLSQVLRRCDEAIRIHAARTIRMFQREYFESTNGKGAGELFLSSTKPFFERVWPQERSLASEGISRELAELPTHSGTAFHDAVDVIERFLVPFDCWSMFEYGFEEDGRTGPERVKQLDAVVDDGEKARALLKLFDVTIGETENSVIPYDLGSALGRIEELAPNVRNAAAFRRLATAARR